MKRLNLITQSIRSFTSTTTTSSSTPQIVYPTAPIFNRREKRKLRIAYPRPDRSPSILYPQTPARFPNKVTLADGSSITMVTSSPKSNHTLVRDVTNHPLWNPSLAREVADADQSGRVGRFTRRYQNPSSASSSSTSENSKEEEPIGTSTDDLDWMSGNSSHTFYGEGNAKNILGIKKSTSNKKK
ncbi:uncharacterized protein MELLADRAFT_112422 [Melampsora larici-populina 98AG31]|uniref:Ribosomal protein bL31m N-terminal domain-containing protein n=1 Tax=Melampsora larici-populina (strain 98AG31 / pathotype 3-4-7) TaxID=747676 RepID=F4S6F3_MELLP|nr:uncharacterized protein MELLADRAFT_112422 [Melampsora larici-populina 98AG31]EGF99802.1 hypothetical protein MELLADRAFT_112422 [Melampsora larici-populina 98AG31]